jgi:hypothetical protein
MIERAMRVRRLVRWALRGADGYDAEDHVERLELCQHILECQRCQRWVRDMVRPKWRKGIAA